MHAIVAEVHILINLPVAAVNPGAAPALNPDGAALVSVAAPRAVPMP